MIPSRSVSRAVVSVHDDYYPPQKLSPAVKAKVQENRQDSRVKDDKTTLQALDTFLRSNRLQDRNVLQL